jgi:hypothetical protein
MVPFIFRSDRRPFDQLDCPGEDIGVEDRTKIVFAIVIVEVKVVDPMGRMIVDPLFELGGLIFENGGHREPQLLFSCKKWICDQVQ